MRLIVSACATLAFAALASTAAATTVSYDLSQVSGNTWQYDFSVANDSLGVPIGEWRVFFDYGPFTNLSFVAQPPNYDLPLVAQPDLIFGTPVPGFVDFLALTGGQIDPGATLGGFVVQADFSGSGTPGAPAFAILDPNTFASLDSGVASANGSTSVPAPATPALLCAGLLAMAVGRHRRRRA